MPIATTLCEARPQNTSEFPPQDDARAESCCNQGATDSVSAALRKVRVLIADDYEDTCQTMALLLRLWGHEVRMAGDGAVALETARVWRPDVILADIGMPNLNGYDLARQLRLQPGFQQTLLIAISGFADQAHRALGLEAGYDAYLAKPAAAAPLQQLLYVEQVRLRMMETMATGAPVTIESTTVPEECAV